VGQAVTVDSLSGSSRCSRSNLASARHDFHSQDWVVKLRKYDRTTPLSTLGQSMREVERNSTAPETTVPRLRRCCLNALTSSAAGLETVDPHNRRIRGHTVRYRFASANRGPGTET
jgi:hypothetical protein